MLLNYKSMLFFLLLFFKFFFTLIFKDKIILQSFFISFLCLNFPLKKIKASFIIFYFIGFVHDWNSAVSKIAVVLPEGPESRCSLYKNSATPAIGPAVCILSAFRNIYKPFIYSKKYFHPLYTGQLFNPFVS